MAHEFPGLSRDLIAFFEELAENNSKPWFDANRQRYEAGVLEPARELVVALGEQLKEISPGIHAEPKVNRSLFRINRDTRFSKDKTPYKTNLALFLWEGSRKRMECPGYYFHLEPFKLLLGVGMHMFPRDLLPRWRERVADPESGASLERAIAGLPLTSGCGMGGEQYKRVPRGYPADHPRAALLRHKGLHVGFEGEVPDALFGPGCVDWCMERYRAFAPVQHWLRDNL